MLDLKLENLIYFIDEPFSNIKSKFERNLRYFKNKLKKLNKPDNGGLITGQFFINRFKNQKMHILDQELKQYGTNQISTTNIILKIKIFE